MPFLQNGKTEFSLPEPSYLAELEEKAPVEYDDKAVAPMPGVVDKLLVKSGDVVKRGDSLFVLIAMKMEHVVKANRDAVIKSVSFKIGDYVPKDATIVKFESDEEKKVEPARPVLHGH